MSFADILLSIFLLIDGFLGIVFAVWILIFQLKREDK